MLVKDTGICLARRDYSETSQIATIFTCDNGKIKGIAKGARRPKSKFSGGIELLSQGQLVFSPGRGSTGLLNLAEWTARQSYSGLRHNLPSLYRAYYLAELMDLFTAEADPHPQLYDCFDQALSDLADSQDWIGFLFFQIQLLQEVGLIPELARCGRCGKDANGRYAQYLSSSEGGILCRACAEAITEKEQITPPALKIIRTLAAAVASSQLRTPADKLTDTGKVPTDHAHARQAQDLLDYWIRSALNRRPKTAHLLR